MAPCTKPSQPRWEHPRWARLVAFALAIPLGCLLQPARSATLLSYISSPYSYVGHGETVSVGPEDGFLFTPYPQGDNSLSISIINDFASNPDISARWYYLDFAAPSNQPLTVGTYTDATRYPFQQAPSAGLSFSANGAGNNTLTGSFTVLEASYGEDGSLLSFAADFLQYDEGQVNGWNKGAIRFNSAIPVSLIAEPISEEPPEELGSEPNAFIPLDPGPGDEGNPTPIEQELELSEEEFVWREIYFSSGSSAEMGVFETPIYQTLESNQATAMAPVTATPGPLPVAAALAGWSSARRLRRRCKEGAGASGDHSP